MAEKVAVQWTVYPPAQGRVFDSELELNQQELGQWLAQDLEKVRLGRVQVLQNQAQELLAVLAQVQVEVVRLVQDQVEQSQGQGQALAESALLLAQEQQRLVHLQMAQV